jgi:kynurenine formamidase
MSRKIIDLSYTICTDMPLYLTLPSPAIEKLNRIERDLFTITKMELVTHCGTHIESPLHVIENGKTIEGYVLRDFIKPGVVINLCNGQSEISRKELERFSKDIKRGETLAIYTGIGSKYGRNRDYLFRWRGLSHAAAEYLAKKHLSVLGIDGISITGWDDSVPAQPRLSRSSSLDVHKLLLSRGTLLVEELANLEQILQGADRRRAIFFFAPLKIRGSEASPIRAYAVC